MSLPPEQMIEKTKKGKKRRRHRSFTSKEKRGEFKTKIFDRVNEYFTTDMENRDIDRESRLQRYAKFRMWVEPKSWPWPNSSNIPLSDMIEQSLRAQDTIHNAVMSNRPVSNATAIHKNDKDKEELVDNIIDYQVFEDMEGENFIGDLADAFISDGVYTAFVPWVKEKREIMDMRLFDKIPDEAMPIEHFQLILKKTYPDAQVSFGSAGWSATVEFTTKDGEDKKLDIEFYTRETDDLVEMIVRDIVVTFNGPRPICMDYDDVFHPTQVENLQIPSPSNPRGSPHVILRFHPTIDEIRRLAKAGFYDLLDTTDLDSLINLAPAMDDDEEEQRDAIAGQTDEPKSRKVKSHTRLTMLLCFDMYDIDEDGIDEDVIFWVLKEAKTTAKAAYLTELYPSRPPRRPFGEAVPIPVRGRRVGISFLEMLEGLHDMMKATLDQACDAGTLGNAPFFFYRAAAGTRPEIIDLMPGEGYPVNDPQRDIHFPTIGNPSAQSFAINMVTLIGSMQERMTMQGSVQFGRVPPGSSSALRTVGGLALLSGQGEARPERMLRRFFVGLMQVWKQIHQLNQYFLPKDKQFRMADFVEAGKDPYHILKTREEIKGRFDFNFKASVLNTSKQQLQASIAQMMQTYISQIAIQMGIVQPDGMYRLLRDFGKSLGQDPDLYLTPPTPDSGKPRILSEEAISAILRNTEPDGLPLEPGGAIEHFQKLIEFQSSDNFGLFKTPDQIELFASYLMQVRTLVQQQQQQMAMQQAAQIFQQQLQSGQPGGGRPMENMPQKPGTPMVSGGGELIDESLPSNKPEEK